ncbi:MAG: hypothetical protein V5A68_08505, partial [Candidatus Thermoplasmatota archaeon]
MKKIFTYLLVILCVASVISTNFVIKTIKAQDTEPLFIELDEEWSSKAKYIVDGKDYFGISLGVKAYMYAKPNQKWGYSFRVAATSVVNDARDKWYNSGMTIIEDDSANLDEEGLVNTHSTQAYNYSTKDSDSVDDEDIKDAIDVSLVAASALPYVGIGLLPMEIAQALKDTDTTSFLMPQGVLHKESYGTAWYDVTATPEEPFWIEFNLASSIFANVEDGYVYSITSLNGKDQANVEGEGKIRIKITPPEPADLVAKEAYISEEPKDKDTEITNKNAEDYENQQVYLNFEYKNTNIEPPSEHDV